MEREHCLPSQASGLDQEPGDGNGRAGSRKAEEEDGEHSHAEGGDLTVTVQVNGRKTQALLDTGACSVWVSDAGYCRHVGTPTPTRSVAKAADSSDLDVTGDGSLTFQWWESVFKDHPLRFLRGLDTPILIGLNLQREVGLQLDLLAMRGAFAVNGFRYERLRDGS